MEPKSLRGGIDVGSTTVKVVIMDENNDSVYQTYQRHFSDVKKASEKVLREAAEAVGLDTPISFTITGSGGMGLADVLNLKFIQEVSPAPKRSRSFVRKPTLPLNLAAKMPKSRFSAHRLNKK